MKYTEQQLTDQNPCQEGFDFAKQNGFDFIAVWKTNPRPDWLMWMLVNNNLITAEQVVKLSAIFAERAMVNYSAKNPSDSKSADLVAAVKAYDSNPTPETKAQIDALQKAGNGTFDCASVVQKGGAVDTSSLSKLMALDLNYRSFNAGIKLPDNQDKLDALMAEQADVVRTVIACPFE